MQAHFPSLSNKCAYWLKFQIFANPEDYKKIAGDSKSKPKFDDEEVERKRRYENWINNN